MPDWIMAAVAVMALLLAFITTRTARRTLRLQARPFLSLNFVEGDNPDEIKKCLAGGQLEPVFTICNSGMSPCIVTKINRSWRTYDGFEPVPKKLISEHNPVKEKRCYIPIGAGQDSTQISAQLYYAGKKGFGDKFLWDKENKNCLFFILDLEYESADGRDKFKARFTYVTKRTKLSLAFPRTSREDFNFQRPIQGRWIKKSG